jgi:membrane associated rhomboid family serine protease
LGLIAAGCALSRPADTGLLTVLDAHHDRYGALIPSPLRDAEANVHRSPFGRASVHSDLLWVGILGAWLPIAPLSIAALRHWLPSLGAAQLLAYATLAGYTFRRFLPNSEDFLATSFRNSRRGRFWTLLTAAFSPAGLVHWLHTAALLLLVVPVLQTQLGRWRTLAAFAAAGASASLATSVAQAPFAKSASGRASTSGALMGLIALRAFLLPTTPIALGGYELAIGRVLLLHLIMEQLSNPFPRPRGAERLAGLLGGAAVVGVHNPRLWRELLTGEGWGRLADYVRGLV